jgi:acyl-coenzyme A thioesterase 13
MSVDEGKRKARAAVQAMFDRYKLLASKRPTDHVVSISVLAFGDDH